MIRDKETGEMRRAPCDTLVIIHGGPAFSVLLKFTPIAMVTGVYINSEAVKSLYFVMPPPDNDRMHVKLIFAVGAAAQR